jgi:prepilin-type N-terminal cleavage/methylation domain-containing protein
MRSRFHLPSGFTLVEVLLGIIILAIGLLGLAAVFPLVVKQQREAQDTVVGVASARGAEAIISANVGLNSPLTSGGWSKLSWEMYKQAFNNKDSGRMPWKNVFQQLGTINAIYDDSGVFRINSDLGQQNDVVIKPADRLFPSASSGVSPLFVWDMAPALASPVTATALPTLPVFQPLRVTVFVRRVDPGIRVPGNKTLAQLLIDGRDGTGRTVIPVATDTDGNPTQNGLGVYSKFLTPTVTRAHKRYGASGGAFTVIEFGNATDAELGAVRQVGQQLVDIDGNIYTVVGLPDEPDQAYTDSEDQIRRSVVISPGLPTEFIQNSNSTSSGLRWTDLQLLCTPQIPAAVTSFIVRR